MTIALHNGECYLLKQDIKKLEGFHFRSLRRLTRKTRREIWETWILTKHEGGSVQNGENPHHRRTAEGQESTLVWTSHARKRERPCPRSIDERKSKLSSKYYQQLTNDFKTRKINVKQAEAKALNKIEWRRISSARLVCNVRFASLVE